MRQKSGSVVCPNCGRLVGVNDERCLGCGKRNPGMWGFAPALNAIADGIDFDFLVLFGCGALYLATLLYAPDEIRGGGIFSMLSPGHESLLHFGMSGATPLYHGRWWTVLSAGWLHGSLLHIILNIIWVRQLSRIIGEAYGVGRLVIIYTVGSVVGFAVTSGAFFVFALAGFPQFLWGAKFTVGASAPLFGLFGALYLYGQRVGDLGIGKYYLQFALIWLVIGAFASFASIDLIRIDNWAHLGGFFGGYLAAMWLDPRRSERAIHGILAVICLLATAASIVASVMIELPL